MYEKILERELDKRNFRKKILSMDLLEKRPASTSSCRPRGRSIRSSRHSVARRSARTGLLPRDPAAIPGTGTPIPGAGAWRSATTPESSRPSSTLTLMRASSPPWTTSPRTWA
ncbi:NrtR DNA-binding winged helix domain-containing protein [Cystobacter ferrugineus]|uniref:NrtR DNA-binding winged helix domain-containing protein n=1 Tax=Cystobacter ferrugineus TaxID=83449 RepID=UPI003CCC0F32